MKKYFNPTIFLQKVIGDQLYRAMHGPALEAVRREASNNAYWQNQKEQFKKESIQITSRTFPKLFNLCQQAVKATCFSENIEFYITSNPYVNAHSMSSDNPENQPHFVELQSALVRAATDQELLFVLGHEIGHIINGDSQLKKLFRYLYEKLDDAPDFITTRLDLYQLLSELGADRYGYIACGGDEKVSLAMLYKLSAGIDVDLLNMDIDGLIEENKSNCEYFMDRNVDIIHTSHPVHPFRIQALHLYATSKSEAKLEKEMKKFEDRLYDLDEISATRNYFFAAAGLLMANLNEEPSDNQLSTIISNIGAHCWYPVEFVQSIADKDLTKLCQDSVRILLQEDEVAKDLIIMYLLEVANADDEISEEEIQLIYTIGRMADMEDKEIAQYISNHIKDIISPNVYVSHES